jgi:dolichyl-phosphate-mannose--protein O-mannosyl transferase
LLFVSLLLVYEGVVFSRRVDALRLSRAAVAAYCIAVIAISWYFLPIWMGIPVSRQVWQARMWISGSSFMNWI